VTETPGGATDAGVDRYDSRRNLLLFFGFSKIDRRVS